MGECQGRSTGVSTPVLMKSRVNYANYRDEGIESLQKFEQVQHRKGGKVWNSESAQIRDGDRSQILILPHLPLLTTMLLILGMMRIREK